MSKSERESLLAECLEDYHRRRALREPARPEDYAERLGDHFQEFLDVLAAESVIDQVIEPDLVGEHFPRPFGDYTLLKELGGGAMGVVYEAVHRTLGRTVALKILRTGFDTEPLALERFRREARACAQIRHDHIVEIYEAGQAQGRPFYAMPILTGRSLSELIRAGEVPEPDKLCEGLAGVADALHALHEAGIVHRDVKPANIMVDPDGQMVLADFGLAKTASAQALTQTGQALGTPLYMSPEQILGAKDEVDGRSDTYGLGVTLYEALSGKPPFKAANFHALMRMILTDRPKLLSSVAPDAPKDCVNITMKAMEWAKKDRYETAAEMRDDLLAYARGDEVTGRPVAEWRHVWRRYRFRMVGAAAAVAVLAAGVGAFFTWQGAKPVTVEVVCLPHAEVSIDGVRKGMTTYTAEMEPGEYLLELNMIGFEPREKTLTLEPGKSATWETFLIATDPDSSVALELMSKALETELPSFRPAPVHRGAPGSGGPALTALYPRGAVRIGDLGGYRLDLNDVDYETDGNLEFRKNGEVLHSELFDPEDMETVADLPKVVLEGLAVGDVVTWGYFSPDGESFTAEFTVVDPDLSGVLGRIDDVLEGQPELLKRHFRAQAYLDADLDMAALAEARAITAERPDSARGFGVMKKALEDMELKDTALWSDLLQGLSRVPRDRMPEAFGD